MTRRIQIQSDWTVEQTLKSNPNSSMVFMSAGTQCVGCYIQKFCTIKDVAEIYHIDLGKLLKDLNNCEIKNQTVLKKEQ